MILAAVAAGANPAHFGGEASSNDLVARLRGNRAVEGRIRRRLRRHRLGRTRSASRWQLLALVSAKGSAKAIHLARGLSGKPPVHRRGLGVLRSPRLVPSRTRRHTPVPTPTRRRWPSWRSSPPAGTLPMAHWLSSRAHRRPMGRSGTTAWRATGSRAIPTRQARSSRP